jgi:hypothetical protein
MTQTAVEWLYVKMFENKGRITKKEYNQAKEMEREQIIKAYQQGVTDEHGDTITFTTEGEDYYNTL